MGRPAATSGAGGNDGNDGGGGVVVCDGVMICSDAITRNLCQSIYAQSIDDGRRRSVGRRCLASVVRQVDGVNALKGQLSSIYFQGVLALRSAQIDAAGDAI
jgi:hypothetical protein